MQRRPEFKIHKCTFSRIENKAHGRLQCLQLSKFYYRMFKQAFAKVNDINGITLRHAKIRLLFLSG